MALDLGKQYGPLPLGAWIAVVGVGIGIAWYTRKSGQEPTIVEDVGITPGVGTGGSGFTTVPPTNNPTNTAPASNEEWAQKAAQWLIAMGYPSAVAQQAVSKYVNGKTLSAQEYTLIALALVAIGPLPQGKPSSPDEEEPPVTPPAIQPYVLYYKSGSRPAVWGLAGGSEKWQETYSQAQANRWATQHMDDGNALTVTAETYDQLKKQYKG